MRDSIPSFKTSLLLRRIQAAIDEHAPFRGKIHVSVANETKWEKVKSGNEVLVRWACWNLEEERNEVTQPEFEVLSHDVTRERLAAELPLVFPGLEVEVDDAIDV